MPGNQWLKFGIYLGDNCIQIFYSGNVRYTVENWSFTAMHMSGAIELNFLSNIQQYTSPNEHFEYGYPHSNALLLFRLKLEHCKPQKDAHHPLKCDVINDNKNLTLFLLAIIFIVCW